MHGCCIYELESPSVQQKIEQLNQILNENTEEKNGKIQKKKEHVEDKLVSLVDKYARHGAKSDSKPFTGYKANIMKSEDGFVTTSMGQQVILMMGIYLCLL